jgi:UDP-N-acetylglucosamine 2-epimerase (non-hydrolysing)/GDP/UDP-N,N'-diacetylbacillosamine 2-epimerase (hydrolysing)
MKRTIAVVTTSRADYSLLYWPLKDMASHPDLDVKIIAMGSHLSPEFGCTIQEIERDGFRVDVRVECLLSSDSDIGMAKTIGVATLSLAESLGQMRPDLLVLTADRYEMLAPAAVALALRIPVAHIEGGEISEGAIDDAVRNALTKLSHIHFASTETARARVVSMGEEDWRVHRVGAPALDHLKRGALLSREEIEARLALNLTRSSAVVTFHPVTIARDTTREAEAFFDALLSVSGQLLFCYPNADAGSRALIERVKTFAAGRANTRLFVNLEPIVYWSLLPHVDLLLGNSSSGIFEAASLELPSVNVGIRQRGRERGRNVLDAEAVTDQILDRVATAQSEEFRRSLKGMANPYGDGCASRRIVDALASVKLGEELLIKRAPSR